MSGKVSDLANAFVETATQKQQEWDADISIDEVGKGLLAALSFYIVNGTFRLEAEDFERFKELVETRKNFIEYFEDISAQMYTAKCKERKNNE